MELIVAGVDFICSGLQVLEGGAERHAGPRARNTKGSSSASMPSTTSRVWRKSRKTKGKKQPITTLHARSYETSQDWIEAQGTSMRNTCFRAIWDQTEEWTSRNRSRTDLLWQEKEGRRNKKDGEMTRSEESWLFVKDSKRKLIDGCWQVPDVGFTI